MPATDQCLRVTEPVPSARAALPLDPPEIRRRRRRGWRAGTAALLAVAALLCGETALAATGMCGKYRGLVVDAADPERRGRVKVSVPSVLFEPAWALPAVPFGKVVVPGAGREVWVEFEQCDTNFPIWIGTPEVECSAIKAGRQRDCRAAP